ncbi:fructose-6-P Phosphotransferase domain protein, partial [Chlamydia psittaci 06-1683]
GYMVTINNLALPYNEWSGGATPLYKMMQLEQRLGEEIPVIKTDSVNPNAPEVQYLLNQSDTCLMEDLYSFPGPLQYFGEERLIDQRPLTLSWGNKK